MLTKKLRFSNTMVIIELSAFLEMKIVQSYKMSVRNEKNSAILLTFTRV